MNIIKRTYLNVSLFSQTLQQLYTYLKLRLGEDLRVAVSKNIFLLKKQVSMIRKYHNHTLQTNPWYQEEELQNTKSLKW